MKRSLCLAVVVLIVTVFSSAALAQQNTGAGPAPGVQQETGKQMTPEEFSALKSRILKRIEVQQTRLNEAKACVNAATTQEELRKCRPMHQMGPGGGMHRGPGQQPPAEKQQ